MYLFEGHLILSLDAKWMELFGMIPSFTVSIKNNRLIIKSSSLIKRSFVGVGPPVYEVKRW